jgi:hypothetical protein
MKLPKSIPSLLGPVHVIQGPETDKLLNRANELGNFRMDTREIRVHTKMPECLQLSTLGHEVFHVIAEDAGLNQLLEPKMQEALSDAFGTWFASAVMTGKLSVK